MLALDPVLAFQCLADAQVVDDALADRIVLTFRDRLGRETDADRQAVIAAFGVVAADRRPRGRAVFDLLVRIASEGGDRRRAAAAVAALAATNLPRAAESLVGFLPTEPEAEPALVGMGDLAVPALRTAALRGQGEALRVLWRMRTPRAAVALCAFSLDPSSTDVAFYLGDLLRERTIEKALREVPQGAFAPGYLWVWKPFAVGADDPLVRRVSVIAAAIAERRMDPPLGVEMDPRILAALSLTQWDARQSSRLAPSRLNELITPALGERPTRSVPPSGELAATAEAGLREAGGLPLAPSWMLHLLPAELRLRAIRVLTRQNSISTATWERVNEPIQHPDYAFGRSWHFRLGLALILAVSVAAAERAADAAVGWHPWGPVWLGWVAVLLIVGGWGLLLATEPIGLVMLPPVCVYATVAWRDWWGTVPAVALGIAVVGACAALALRGEVLTVRADVSVDPLRRFVQDHLNP
ncbi:hypothetical protein [Streptomyces sp. BPTC-684]|uniref:hypothetical protein n=1 Tax=Streptomyces sp. BPTC-684 TaxID=3043734 RepID=UPI0024B07FEB|nr:hypothetical protein [Streptomyces sp. BPTC-684]WHM35876.1 hypothetical protein QIY60_02420 [Streptomyces sp. BPTC-684]